ncbi:MAG: hypothetical protein RPS47_11725 [Colwellia sp.]|jgi:hypothetical protein
MLTIDQLALRAASEAFGNRIPDDWEQMGEDSQVAWLDSNRQENFECISTDQYYSLIDCHADTIKKAIEEAFLIAKGLDPTQPCPSL